jgi:hypothetical protein
LKSSEKTERQNRDEKTNKTKGKPEGTRKLKKKRRKASALANGPAHAYPALSGAAHSARYEQGIGFADLVGMHGQPHTPATRPVGWAVTH